MKIEIKIAPVQKFIAHSKNALNYWASSHILSELSYTGLSAYFKSPHQAHTRLTTYSSFQELQNQYAQQKSLCTVLGFPHSMYIISESYPTQLVIDIRQAIHQKWSDIVLKSYDLLLKHSEHQASFIQLSQILEYFKIIITVDNQVLSIHSNREYERFDVNEKKLNPFSLETIKHLYAHYLVEDNEQIALLKKRLNKPNEMALMILDGDKMGDFIRSQKHMDIKDFNHTLLSFNREVHQEMHMENHQVLYGAGDDLVILTTPEKAVEVAQATSQLFGKHIKQLIETKKLDTNRMTTLSSAINLNASLTNFQYHFTQTKKALEIISKEKMGRNATTVIYDTHCNSWKNN